MQPGRQVLVSSATALVSMSNTKNSLFLSNIYVLDCQKCRDFESGCTYLDSFAVIHGPGTQQNFTNNAARDRENSYDDPLKTTL